VIISAGSDLRKVASDLDAFSFVTKPIDGDELIAVLSEACCQSQRLRLQFGSDEVK
jgi:DNA-binding NtrC family response regulator